MPIYLTQSQIDQITALKNAGPNAQGNYSHIYKFIGALLPAGDEREKGPGSIYDKREVMPRRARIHPFGLPLHMVQCGHDRNASCFFCENRNELGPFSLPQRP